jgi:hypothetical protein
LPASACAAGWRDAGWSRAVVSLAGGAGALLLSRARDSASPNPLAVASAVARLALSTALAALLTIWLISVVGLATGVARVRLR